MMNRARSVSPAAKRSTPAAATAIPATEAIEAPAVPPKDEVPATETAAEEAAPTTAGTAATEPEAAIEKSEPAVAAVDSTKAVTPKEGRRKSYFGGFGGPKKDTVEGENEKPLQKITNIFRNPSKAVRNNKEPKKEVAAPTTVEETPAQAASEPTTQAEEPVAEPEQKQQNSIGDVTADSVTVGQPQQSAPAVSASA